MNLFTEYDNQQSIQEKEQHDKERQSKFPQHCDINYRINFKSMFFRGSYYYKMIRTNFYNYRMNEDTVLHAHNFFNSSKPIPISNELLISMQTIRDHHPFVYKQLIDKFEIVAFHYNLGWCNNIYKQDNLF